MLAFPLEKIVPDYFFNDGVRKVRVNMMVVPDWEWNIAYNLDWDSNVIEIPMSGKGLVFLLILPKNIKGMSRLLKAFNFSALDVTLKAFHKRQSELYLPQFKIDCDYDLPNSSPI